jgi:hypothetical protein
LCEFRGNLATAILDGTGHDVKRTLSRLQVGLDAPLHDGAKHFARTIPGVIVRDIARAEEHQIVAVAALIRQPNQFWMRALVVVPRKLQGRRRVRIDE